ncbi:MAG: Rho termination factor N-terminal domain-containing protein [Proteobacteria bacterium]|nr:Rho termination factor N-terminal domain-containing protein [Pseudomonadota bacterium]MBU1709574.1 Rho termination factor N-terminal domain-containing protein [Pseudomonadota bacterium]
MTMNEIKQKAQQMGIKVGKMKKGDLIRSIQVEEGNFPCFGTPSNHCDQLECSWRNDCLAT